MPTSSAFFVGQQALDQFLRYGGNTDQLRMRVIHLFQMDIPMPLMTTRLQALYHGGNGITTEHGPMAAWYDEDGIHLAHGDRARYETNAQVIPWERAAQRIGELLEAGQFASNVELLEADGYERNLLAQSLIYLYRDLNREDHPNDFLPCLTDGAKWLDFTKDEPRLSNLLADPDFRKTLLAEYRTFLAALRVGRSGFIPSFKSRMTPRKRRTSCGRSTAQAVILTPCPALDTATRTTTVRVSASPSGTARKSISPG